MKFDVNDDLRANGPEAVRDRSDKAETFDKGEKEKLIAAPYRWPDPAKIPPRQFIFGKHYIRQSVGGTVGGGGRLKTTTGLTEAIGMTARRDLLAGTEFKEPLRVWFLSGEETQNELDIRTAAICQHHHVSKSDCGDRLFVQSVRNKPPRFATLDKNGRAILNKAALDDLEAEIRIHRFDVVMIDPLISFHSVNENSNEDIDLLIKEGLGAVAERTGCAIEVYHHPGKPKPGQAENTVDDARGASAFIWAVRSARVFNFMTPDEAKRLGIAEDDRRLHIRISNGKANMGPLGKADWIKIEVENMPNGDEIACASSWKPPDPFQGVSTADMHKCRTLAQTGAYRANIRSAEWIGYVIADMLNIKVAHGADNNREDLTRIKQIVKTWIKNGVLAIEKRKDSSRKDREFIIPGRWSDAESDPDSEEIALQ
jgi:hypothetical protein